MLLLCLPAEGASLLSPFFALQTDSTVERHARHDGLTRTKDGRRIWKNCHQPCAETPYSSDCSTCDKAPSHAGLSPHRRACYSIGMKHIAACFSKVLALHVTSSRCAISTLSCPLFETFRIPAQFQMTTTKPASHAKRQTVQLLPSIQTTPYQNSAAACMCIVK